MPVMTDSGVSHAATAGTEGGGRRVSGTQGTLTDCRWLLVKVEPLPPWMPPHELPISHAGVSLTAGRARSGLGVPVGLLPPRTGARPAPLAPRQLRGGT